jgi:2'-5' RNA ligase
MGVEQGVDEIRELQAAVDHHTEQIGYSGENRLFVPHLTLARIRNFQGDFERLQELFDSYSPGPLTATHVTEVITYASFIDRGAPTYEVLGRCKLYSEIGHTLLAIASADF